MGGWVVGEREGILALRKVRAGLVVMLSGDGDGGLGGCGLFVGFFLLAGAVKLLCGSIRINQIWSEFVH